METDNSVNMSTNFGIMFVNVSGTYSSSSDNNNLFIKKFVRRLLSPSPYESFPSLTISDYPGRVQGSILFQTAAQYISSQSHHYRERNHANTTYFEPTSSARRVSHYKNLITLFVVKYGLLSDSIFNKTFFIYIMYRQQLCNQRNQFSQC